MKALFIRASIHAMVVIITMYAASHIKVSWLQYMDYPKRNAALIDQNNKITGIEERLAAAELWRETSKADAIEKELNQAKSQRATISQNFIDAAEQEAKKYRYIQLGLFALAILYFLVTSKSLFLLIKRLVETIVGFGSSTRDGASQLGQFVVDSQTSAHEERTLNQILQYKQLRDKNIISEEECDRKIALLKEKL